MTAEGDSAPASDIRALYHLRLFVSGASDLSARAIDDVTRLCDRHVDAGVRLTVVDIHDHPTVALSSDVRVVPTLVRILPLPVRRIVGDLSDTERVLAMLLVPEVTKSPSAAP